MTFPRHKFATDNPEECRNPQQTDALWDKLAPHLLHPGFNCVWALHTGVLKGIASVLTFAVEVMIQGLGPVSKEQKPELSVETTFTPQQDVYLVYVTDISL